jgi:hypothetical protein
MTNTSPKKRNGKEWGLALLAILLALSTGFNFRCYHLNGHKATDQAGLETGLVAELKAKIASQVNDPESVRWGEFEVVSPTVVCGTMNWKGRYGGYVGVTSFVWNEEGNILYWLGTGNPAGKLLFSSDFPLAFHRGDIIRDAYDVYANLLNRTCKSDKVKIEGMLAFEGKLR